LDVEVGTRTEETTATGGGKGSGCASNGCESGIVGRTWNIGMVAGLVRRLESKAVGGVRGDSSKNQPSSCRIGHFLANTAALLLRQVASL
jgi:hypothetical protein